MDKSSIFESIIVEYIKNRNMKALDVAKYILAKSDEYGDLTTNKKLQKLLYYIKAWGLVYIQGGIIDEPFEAWVHGPVCRVVYYHYRGFGYAPIGENFDGQSPSEYIAAFEKAHTADEIELINTVYEKYSPLSSMELELLSHSEQPWIDARGALPPIENGSSVISEETMKSFYSAKVPQ